MDNQISFLFQLYLTGRRIRAKFKHRNEDVMLRVTTFMLLEKNKLTVSQLAEKLYSKVSAISEQMHDMEEEGCVKKNKEEDGRESYIELTEKGKEKLGAYIAGMKSHYSLMKGRLTDEEKACFLKVLEKIAA